MPLPNNFPLNIQRWLDSQTGIVGSTSESQRDYRVYTGQKYDSYWDTNPRAPLLFGGVRIKGKLVQKAVPGMPSGYYLPLAVDGIAPYTNSLWSSNPQVILARNKAYTKILEKVKGDTSSLAVAAAEGRETFEMVAKRVTGLYRAYKSLRKGDFKQFLRELSVDPKRKHRSLVRSASNEASGLWLEYWFGWSPTVQDFGSAAMALSVNPVLASVVERSGASFILSEKSVTVGNVARRTITQSGRGIVRHGARFTLINENLFLANRLGLINPMLVAWELVPFSFVVDWFTKFGTYIESFTDLAGLAVNDEWSTQYARVHQQGSYFPKAQPTNRCEAEWEMHLLQRGTSLLKPLPVYPKLLNFGDSTTRAATAVSLLNVLFLSGKN